jgi:hypothetical protein
MTAMEPNPNSMYEWRRPRGGLNTAAEKISGMGWSLVSRKGMLSDARKRELYNEGVEGTATILKAPGKGRVGENSENLGRFTARIEIPGREPYEQRIWMSFWKAEWDALRPGAVVPCAVDPDDPKKVLLVAPEPG